MLQGLAYYTSTLVSPGHTAPNPDQHTTISKHSFPVRPTSLLACHCLLLPCRLAGAQLGASLGWMRPLSDEAQLACIGPQTRLQPGVLASC